MTKKEFKREFLDVFLLVPTGRQVTSSQMESMEKLAEMFSDLPLERAEAMLLFFQRILGNPDDLKKILVTNGATLDDLTDVQSVVNLLIESSKAEQKRAD